jgi:addiction module RelE/StbE family toxin
MSERELNRLTFSPWFEKLLPSLKRKNPDLVRAFAKHLPKIVANPGLGKPLRHSLQNFRRIHIEGSFVLLYEVREREVRLIDLDHHDRVYKKYS